MEERVQTISFQVVPGPRGLVEAEKRLHTRGFEQIKPTRDGRRLQVVAPRKQVESVLGSSLAEKRRRSRIGAVEQVVVDLELPEGAVLPANLQDVVAELIFPVTPVYYRSPTKKRKSLG